MIDFFSQITSNSVNKIAMNTRQPHHSLRNFKQQTQCGYHWWFWWSLPSPQVNTLWYLQIIIRILENILLFIIAGTADIRINGGRNVTLREFSYQVSIQHGVTRQHVGGGVFIGRYTVLTAAHIIAQAGPNATQIHIRYNSLNHGSGGSLRQAHRVIIHPNFNPGTLEHDIAIIKLQRAVRGVVRADLPSRRSSLNINDTLTISGWGQRTGARNITATLEAVDLQVTDQQQCAAAYQPLHNFPNVTNGMLCAAWLNNDRGACPVIYCHFTTRLCYSFNQFQYLKTFEF